MLGRTPPFFRKRFHLSVLAVVFSVLPSVSLTAFAQSYQQGKVLKWDVEPYGEHANVTRNVAIYYIQVGTTVYQVTRGTTKPDGNLTVGQQVQCRIEKDHFFTPGEKGKEVKYSIIGASEAQ